MYGGKYSEPKLVSEPRSRKLKYKPVGIPNHRNMPNKNLTVGQNPKESGFGGFSFPYSKFVFCSSAPVR